MSQVINQVAGLVSRVKESDRGGCCGSVQVRFSVERMMDKDIRGSRKTIEHDKGEDHRPWGFYEVLANNADHKIKRITVYPGGRLSYQRHFHRAEHWYLISGRAMVTRDNEAIELSPGQAVDLPVGAWHRIQNPGPENLVFIEVQTGDYFGEDDIQRIEDDYGRV